VGSMQQPSYRSQQAPEAEHSVRRREGGTNAEVKTDPLLRERHSTHFRANLLTEEFRSFSRSPSTVKLFSVEKSDCRGNDSVFDSEGAHGQLDAASGSQKVARHGFRGTWIFGETGCNHIWSIFFWSNHPQKALTC
jgi:hypothetical protein